MTPRTGRPKEENPRSENIRFRVTKEKKNELVLAYEKDANPNEKFSTWIARIVTERMNEVLGR